MMNVMKLKARLRKFAADNNTTAQAALQMSVMEAFVRRLAISPHRDRIIMKGGFLIAHITSIAMRTTMDLDGTVRRMPLTADSLGATFSDICAIDLDDGFSFSLGTIEAIRENSFYSGLRVSLKAEIMGAMTVPLKFDVTTGDMITPGPVAFDMPMLLSDGKVPVLAYTLESILAEKLHAILSLGIANTRMRDFYDVAVLSRTHHPDCSLLKTALGRTAAQRHGERFILEHRERLAEIASDAIMRSRWETYRANYKYVGDMEFGDALSATVELMSKVLREA